MNVIITGASGFIGSNILDFLYKKKINIYIYSFNKKTYQKIKRKYVNIKNFNKLNEKTPIDCVIHCAAPNDLKSNSSFQYSIKGYLQFTIDFLEQIKNLNIKKIIYLSTAQVYGKNLKNDVTEKTECLYLNNYGLFHKFCEDLIKNYVIKNNLKTNYFLLRISNVLGDTKFYNKQIFRLLPNDICKNFIKKGFAELRSSGRQYRNFISINDLVKIFYFLLKKKNIRNGIYNISGKNLRVIDMVKIIIEVYKKRYKKNPKIIILTNKNPGPVKLNYDCKKLKKETNFKIKNDFKKSINEIFEKLN